METTSTYDRRKSKEDGRRRIVAIRERLRYGLGSKQEVADIVADRRKRDRVIRGMVDRGELHEYWIERMDEFDQPARFVYSVSHHPKHLLAHNHAVMLVLQSAGWPECELNPAPINGCIPDAIVCVPRQRILELDTGTEGQAKIREKAKAYADCDLPIVWVTKDNERRNRLIEWTPELHGRSVFGIFREVTALPNDKVWMRDDGTMVAMKWCHTPGPGPASCVVS